MADTLYSINEQLRELLENLPIDEDTGEVDFSAVEQNEADFKVKAESVAIYIKSEKYLADQIGAEIDELTERKKRHEAHVDRLKEYLASCLIARGESAFETPKCKVTFRKSTSCEVDMDALPDEWKTEVISVKADKKAIAAAISGGTEVPGATLIVKQNIQVK